MKYHGFDLMEMMVKICSQGHMIAQGYGQDLVSDCVDPQRPPYCVYQKIKVEVKFDWKGHRIFSKGEQLLEVDFKILSLLSTLVSPSYF